MRFLKLKKKYMISIAILRNADVEKKPICLSKAYVPR